MKIKYLYYYVQTIQYLSIQKKVPLSQKKQESTD